MPRRWTARRCACRWRGSVSSVGSKNTVTCAVYYKLTTSASWVQATTVSASNYAVSAANLLLSATFDALKSYDLKVRLSDYFYYVEQSVSVGTKQVLMDFYKDGNGVAFGKVAEKLRQGGVWLALGALDAFGCGSGRHRRDHRSQRLR